MTEQVAIAIELPTDAAALVEDVVADMKQTASVEVKPPTGAGQNAGDLTFDPVSGAAVGWFVLKIVGEAAIALTGAIIGELIHKKLKERQELARKTVRIRFPDGVVYELVVDDPQSMARLKQLIAGKAAR